MTSRSALVAAPLIFAALALSACSTGAPGKSSSGKLSVVASFYPLQFAAEQIGGGHVAVTSLTRPGTEPHDIELTTRDVATVSEAGLVVYEKGLQGAVDKAVESQAPDRSLDVSSAAELNLRLTTGGTDPHFWLDPGRYSHVAEAIAARLSAADPAHKADYKKNAESFAARLTMLSEELSAGLASCQRRDLVTSHAAFGYLAQRFGMKQVAITGISPEQEPDAAEIAAVSTFARANGVTTVYSETLASPAIAQTVAREAGAKVATLDPIEGLTRQSSGKDYFEVMRSNLRTLQAGQGCS
ncbi:MAG: metal ABC transporter substrate-binding protein [Actinomycetota bacterium]